jgi:hypothetical protein
VHSDSQQFGAPPNPTRLLLRVQVVPDQCGLGAVICEDTIAARAFELLFAFDEVIAAGGYREDVNLHAIRTNLEMESHEEKLAQARSCCRRRCCGEGRARCVPGCAAAELVAALHSRLTTLSPTASLPCPLPLPRCCCYCR